jgi:hypothetical protein
MQKDQELKMAILQKLMEEMKAKSAHGLKPKADLMIEAHGEAIPKHGGSAKDALMKALEGSPAEEASESPHELMMEKMHPEMEQDEEPVFSSSRMSELMKKKMKK